MATMKTITAQDFRAMVEIGEMRLSENAEIRKLIKRIPSTRWRHRDKHDALIQIWCGTCCKLYSNNCR